MADLSITAANVKPGTTCTTTNGTYGETVTAGQAVYKSASDNYYYKAECDSTTAKAAAVGIALNSGSQYQPATILTSGNCSIGATVTVGSVYIVSATAGGIAPTTDLASTNYVTILGVGDTAATLLIKINASGAQKA